MCPNYSRCSNCHFFRTSTNQHTLFLWPITHFHLSHLFKPITQSHRMLSAHVFFLFEQCCVLEVQMAWFLSLPVPIKNDTPSQLKAQKLPFLSQCRPINISILRGQSHVFICWICSTQLPNHVARFFTHAQQLSNHVACLKSHLLQLSNHKCQKLTCHDNLWLQP